jgi:hypothetical protein
MMDGYDSYGVGNEGRWSPFAVLIVMGAIRGKCIASMEYGLASGGK